MSPAAEVAWKKRGIQWDGMLTISSRVYLNATNEKALGKVGMDDLRKYAADKEA